MYGYIYKTTNLINGKIYIGKKKGLFDNTYFGSGRYLKNALNKYGVSNFQVEIIEYCETLAIQNEQEKYWIAYYRSNNYDMYNIAVGGDGGDTYYGLTDENRKQRIQKTSEASKRNQALHKESYRLGHIKAWETRRKNGNDVMSDAQKKKLSISHKGKKLSIDTIQKIVNTRKGYRHTEVTRNKISLSNKLKHRTLSDEQRKNLSRINKTRVGSLNGFWGKTHTLETRAIIGKYTKERFANRIWVNNGVVNKRIIKDDLDDYIQLGFIQGRIKWAHNH